MDGSNLNRLRGCVSIRVIPHTHTHTQTVAAFRFPLLLCNNVSGSITAVWPVFCGFTIELCLYVYTIYGLMARPKRRIRCGQADDAVNCGHFMAALYICMQKGKQRQGSNKNARQLCEETNEHTHDGKWRKRIRV